MGRWVTAKISSEEKRVVSRFSKIRTRPIPAIRLTTSPNPRLSSLFGFEGPSGKVAGFTTEIKLA